MEKEKQNKFRSIFAIILVVVVFLIAIITTCILNAKSDELNNIKDSNQQIENLVDDE